MKRNVDNTSTSLSYGLDNWEDFPMHHPNGNEVVATACVPMYDGRCRMHPMWKPADYMKYINVTRRKPKKKYKVN